MSRATFTQWETNKHLPSASRTTHLDQVLDADGELVAAADRSRARPSHHLRPVVTSVPSEPGRPLGVVLRDVRRALLDQLCFADGRAVGWRHNLVESVEPVSIVSTTYALKALALLGGPDGRTSTVVDRVVDAGRDADGRLRGWQASSQSAPRLEATGPALDSLIRAGILRDADVVIRIVEELLDDTTLQRPFILTVGLEPLLQVAPDSGLAERMVNALLGCRQEFAGALLWPEKQLSREQPMLGASLAHTAHAVTVLRHAPERLVGDAVAVAEQWIAEQVNLDGVTEIIRRSREKGGREELAVHHFTSAWVAQALAGSDAPDVRAITRALDVVWERFDSEHHLWAWSNGDVPTWMLGDAVAAVQECALALTLAPTR